MPDPNADQGEHQFNYALVPQVGPGFGAIRAEAEAFNHPVLIAPGLAELPPLVSSGAPNVVIETIKPSQDGRGFVLRLYEAEGWKTKSCLHFTRPLGAIVETNLLESDTEKIVFESQQVSLTFEPFQIRTFRLIERA